MRVVLWDFDCTLAERPGGLPGCLIKVLRAAMPDIAIDEEKLRTAISSGFPWHTPDETHEDIDTAVAWWRRYGPIVEDAYREVGLDAQLARALTNAVQQDYLDPGAWRLYPDTVASLERLERAGWSQYILSNHVPELACLIDALGLRQFITSTINSAETGVEKPHPKAFEIARQTAGNPDVIWMIGDRLGADIRGAQAAGIPGILVARTSARAHAGHLTSSVAEATDLLIDLAPNG